MLRIGGPFFGWIVPSYCGLTLIFKSDDLIGSWAFWSLWSSLGFMASNPSSLCFKPVIFSSCYGFFSSVILLVTVSSKLSERISSGLRISFPLPKLFFFFNSYCVFVYQIFCPFWFFAFERLSSIYTRLSSKVIDVPSFVSSTFYV